jgi:hypothetical protein
LMFCRKNSPIRRSTTKTIEVQYFKVKQKVLNNS